MGEKATEQDVMALHGKWKWDMDHEGLSLG